MRVTQMRWNLKIMRKIMAQEQDYLTKYKVHSTLKHSSLSDYNNMAITRRPIAILLQ